MLGDYKIIYTRSTNVVQPIINILKLNILHLHLKFNIEYKYTEYDHAVRVRHYNRTMYAFYALKKRKNLLYTLIQYY